MYNCDHTGIISMNSNPGSKSFFIKDIIENGDNSGENLVN